jgi:hypothetical protein
MTRFGVKIVAVVTSGVIPAENRTRAAYCAAKTIAIDADSGDRLRMR